MVTAAPGGRRAPPGLRWPGRGRFACRPDDRPKRAPRADLRAAAWIAPDPRPARPHAARRDRRRLAGGAGAGADNGGRTHWRLRARPGDRSARAPRSVAAARASPARARTATAARARARAYGNDRRA